MYDALYDAVCNAAYLAAHLTVYHADGGYPCSGGTPTQTHGAPVGGPWGPSRGMGYLACIDKKEGVLGGRASPLV